MARSTESMPRAVYVSENETRYIEPPEAILMRQLGETSGYTLYCENYLKCDCTANVKVVNRTEKQAFYLKANEGHCPDCSYLLDTVSIKDRIRNVPKDKKIVLKIDESDMFEVREKVIKTEENGNNPKKAGKVLTVPENIITRQVAGTRNTYIRTVGDLIELLNSKDETMIKYTLKQLYTTNMLYSRGNYEEIWNKRPEHSFIVEGYLDQGGLNLLEEKGYVYAFSAYKSKKADNDIRIMLVYNGNGKKRFQQTVKSLIEWIDKEVEGRRKLALIKGNIVNFYEEKKIIVLHVKDIDIKYRKYEYKPDKQSSQQEILQESSLAEVKREIKEEPIPEVNPENKPVEVKTQLIESKQQLDVYTDEFLLQFINSQQLQKMKQTNVPPLPLKRWFAEENTGDTEKYVLVPMGKFMGVANTKRSEGNWLNQLYGLNRTTQNLKRIQQGGIQQFKDLIIRKNADVVFNYYEDLDVYYVEEGGTHRSVIAKVLNIDYMMARIEVYKSNGHLEKEQKLFREQLHQLESIIKELGFVTEYNSSKQTIAIFSNHHQLITVLEDVVYPTFYQEGKNHFQYWLLVFRKLKEEGVKISKKPYFLRKWILFYKKKINTSSHEEYYFHMLRIYTLAKK
ncbi:hypothetical protein [Bacillus sp. FSL K6-2944]|uniref:hypothetical protein n=1 Tax=Bacillus sp. FSL K6-2944 TaxID=2921486 RepID=UPI0030F7F92B